MRSIPVEWSLFGEGPWNYSTNAAFIYQFWVYGAERAKPYESIYTIGMRGDGDRTQIPWIDENMLTVLNLVPLSETTNIDLLEEIVADQRQILTNVFNGTNVTTIPQVWTLCKVTHPSLRQSLMLP